MSGLRTPALLLCSVLLAGPALAKGGSHHAPSPALAQHSGEGYLGIGFHDVPEEEVPGLHLPSSHGALVDVVDHDGPAGQAGLRPRDVITAMNGQVIDGAATLKRLIHEAGCNVSVALQIIRSGRIMTVTAKLSSREDVQRRAQEHLAAPALPPPVAEAAIAPSFMMSDGAGSDAPDPQPTGGSPRSQGFISSMLHTGPFTGLSAVDLSPQLKGFFGAPVGMGVLVDTVAPSSPASAAGLRAGDVLLRADGNVLHSTNDWMRHLKAARGRAITVLLLRDHHELTLTLTPDLKRHASVLLPPAVFTA